MSTTTELKQRLDQIEVEIQEARQRLGAHSVKPALMAALFDLEDERDALLKQIQREAEKCPVQGGPC